MSTVTLRLPADGYSTRYQISGGGTFVQGFVYLSDDSLDFDRTVVDAGGGFCEVTLADGTAETVASPARGQYLLVTLKASTSASTDTAGPGYIDVAPDADGNPPGGYAWVDGLAGLPNYACSAGDYIVPYQNNVQVLRSAQGAGTLTTGNTPNTFSVLANGQGPYAASVEVTIPDGADLIGVYGMWSEQLTESTLNGFVVYAANSFGAAILRVARFSETGVISDNSGPAPDGIAGAGTRQSCIVRLADKWVLSTSVPSAGQAWIVVDSTYTPSLAGGAQCKGPLLGVSSLYPEVLVDLGAEGILYRATLSVSEDLTQVDVGGQSMVMSIAGGNPYNFPMACAEIGPHKYLVAGRMGFAEVTISPQEDGYAACSVKQTAGTHPMLNVTGDTDPISIAYNESNGVQYVSLNTLSHQVMGLDYGVLRSLYVRKAKPE